MKNLHPTACHTWNRPRLSSCRRTPRAGHRLAVRPTGLTTLRRSHPTPNSMLISNDKVILNDHCCRTWNRTKIRSFKGSCPTIRRSGKIEQTYINP